MADAIDPVEVWNDEQNARRLLMERLLLTRSLIEALRGSGGDFNGDIPRNAHYMLVQWVMNHYGGHTPGTGLHEMQIPEGCEAYHAEISAGAHVSSNVAFLLTADYPAEYARDLERIRESLEEYPY